MEIQLIVHSHSIVRLRETEIVIEIELKFNQSEERKFQISNLVNFASIRLVKFQSNSISSLRA